MKSLAAWPAGAVHATTMVPPAVAVAGAERVYVVAVAAAPVPVSGRDCDPALSDAARDPVAVGLKVTVTAQLAPAGRVAPQLFVWLKSAGLAPPIAMARP